MTIFCYAGFQETVRALEDVFTLRWNKYQESLSSGLQGLLLDKDLVDVTLVCDGGEFVKAHKVVLAASSTYFRKMFSVSFNFNYGCIVVVTVITV